MKPNSYLFILCISAACLTFCTSEPKTPVIIGATMSQTGALSTQGIAAMNGYLLCESHINEEGGLLGRQLQFLIYDDESTPDIAISLYEQLISDDGVDAIMGPYGSTLTEAVAPVTEHHQMVHISPLAATTSIWEQGREYLFMVLPPAELFLAGLIELANENGLDRIGIIQQNALFPRAAGDGAAELIREKNMMLTFHETYPTGTEDFTQYLDLIIQTNTQVVGMAASALDDFITFVNQMKEYDVNLQMFGTSGAVAQFVDALGKDAEYVYGLSAWEPGLPNPGIDRFIEDYESTFRVSPSFHAAGAYGSCMIFAVAAEKAGSLDSDAIREVLMNLETQTIFGNYAVDERGYQIANSGLFIQWQDGKKVIVWPDDVAEAQQRFPTPAWSER